MDPRHVDVRVLNRLGDKVYAESNRDILTFEFAPGWPEGPERDGYCRDNNLAYPVPGEARHQETLRRLSRAPAPFPLGELQREREPAARRKLAARWVREYGPAGHAAQQVIGLIVSDRWERATESGLTSPLQAAGARWSMAHRQVLAFLEAFRGEAMARRELLRASSADCPAGEPWDHWLDGPHAVRSALAGAQAGDVTVAHLVGLARWVCREVTQQEVRARRAQGCIILEFEAPVRDQLAAIQIDVSSGVVMACVEAELGASGTLVGRTLLRCHRTSQGPRVRLDRGYMFLHELGHALHHVLRAPKARGASRSGGLQYSSPIETEYAGCLLEKLALHPEYPSRVVSADPHASEDALRAGQRALAREYLLREAADATEALLDFRLHAEYAECAPRDDGAAGLMSAYRPDGALAFACRLVEPCFSRQPGWAGVSYIANYCLSALAVSDVIQQSFDVAVQRVCACVRAGLGEDDLELRWDTAGASITSTYGAVL